MFQRQSGKKMEYLLTVNGFEIKAHYREKTVEEVFVPLLSDLAERSRQMTGQMIVFVAAPPGAGKTTLTVFWERLAKDRQLGDFQTLGLDGFHYRQDYLKRHSVMRDGKEVLLSDVKGCPESFDTVAFADKLAQIRNARKRGEVRWPLYDRTLHEPVADKIPVTGDILLIEGNYLMLDREPWCSLSKKADQKIYIEAEESILRERLIDRKMRGGYGRPEAEHWYETSDGVNVRCVLRETRCGTGDIHFRILEDDDYLLL